MTEFEVDLPCVVWHKSTYSNLNSTSIEVIAVHAWRKSSYSNVSGNCVEVAPAGHAVAVRDSKNPDAPPLAFTPEQWRAFTCKLATGTSGPS